MTPQSQRANPDNWTGWSRSDRSTTGEEKQKEVRLHPDTTHASVQPQQSASPAHTEAETNVGHTPVPVHI